MAAMMASQQPSSLLNCLLLLLSLGKFAVRGLEIKDIDEEPEGPTAQDCQNPVNDIVRENCLPGNPSTEWDINGAGHPSIQGFSTQISYAPGETVQFKVKTDSTDYRFDIYRIGWYSGHGARKVDTVRPSVSLPQVQPECLMEEDTLLVDCGTWFVSGSWQIPGNAVSGAYFARLVRNDPPAYWRMDASPILPDTKFSNRNWDYSKMPPCGDKEDCPGLENSYGAQRLKAGPKTMMRNALDEPVASQIHFVVRQEHRSSDILFQTIDTTSRAYNNYIHPSTYGVWWNPHHNFTVPKSWANRRAYKVSYNVPLLTRDTRAVNFIFNSEFPAIRWLERHGYDIQYWTGVDAHMRGGEISKRAKVYVSVGHDEYWSGQQRLNVEAARDQGVNLMFWSGNEVYWRVRWEASKVDGQAMRTMAIYKESQESSKIDPDKNEWTGTFRDSREINPLGGNPENALTGTIFTVNSWRIDPIEVPGVYAPLRFWRNTEVAKLKPSQKAILLKGLIGHEYDEDLDNGSRPPGLIRMSETTIDNVQVIVDAGGCFDSGTATHHLVLYKASSGAIVFGAGTVQWTWGLDDFHDSTTGQLPFMENPYDTRVGRYLAGTERAVQQATINLFADMKVQPAILSKSDIRAEASTDTEPPAVQDLKAKSHDGRLYLSASGHDFGGGVVAAMEWSPDKSRWHPMHRIGTSKEWQAQLPNGIRDTWVRAVDDSLNFGLASHHQVPANSGEL